MCRLTLIIVFLIGIQEAGAQPAAVLDQAQTLSDRGEYLEAAQLYQSVLLEALSAQECTVAEKALEGLRTTAYWGRSPGLLDSVESPAMWTLLEESPDCGAVFLVQLFLAFKQTRQGDQAAALLQEAEMRSSPVLSKYLKRIQPLVTESVHVEMTPIYMEGASEIDAAEWAAPFPARVDREDQVVSGGEFWHGRGDLSAEVRLGRMAENFYFRIEVTDEQHLTAGPAQDEVILCFDASQGSGSVFQRDPERAENPYVIRVGTAPTEGPEPIPALQRAWRVARCDENGYAMVVCLPKGSLGDIEATAGNRYGMDVMIRDVDGDGESILRWMELSTDPEALYWAGVLAIQ